MRAPGATEWATYTERADLWRKLGLSTEKIHWATVETGHYRVIRKERGNGRPPRLIYSPPTLLKRVQRRINKRILVPVALPPCVHSCKGHSIVTNAWPHVGQECVAAFDLRDFFPSISARQVEDLFYGLGFRKSLVTVLTRLTTADGYLQQGLPTSSAIANILALPLDGRLLEYSALRNLVYTRYVDDLTLSGRAVDMADISADVSAAISQSGFVCSTEKTRTMPSCEVQIVTGLVVNSLIDVTPEYERDLLERIDEFCEAGPCMSPTEFADTYRCLYSRLQFVRFVRRERGDRLLAAFNERLRPMHRARLGGRRLSSGHARRLGTRFC